MNKSFSQLIFSMYIFLLTLLELFKTVNSLLSILIDKFKYFSVLLVLFTPKNISEIFEVFFL